MIRFIIDDKANEALQDWFFDNQSFALNCPFFYKRVRMEMNTKPCGSVIHIEAGRSNIEATFRVKAEQLSFYEDASRMLKSSNQEEIEAAKMCIGVYKKREMYRKRTTAKFTFLTRQGASGIDYKIKKLPTLDEYYGFESKILFNDMLSVIAEGVYIDKERYFEDSVRNNTAIMKDVFEDFTRQYMTVFFAANAFLFYCNKDQDRYIRANTRTEGGDKVIVFSILPDCQEDDRGGLYAVDVSGRETVDGENKVFAVRGHLRRYDSKNGHWKKDKVIWIDSFFKGTGADKKSSKKPKDDFTKEDPNDWIADVSEK